ncbi:MAG: glucan biosynthesis protein [Hyphomicrobiales bacterium]|nr:glucan biosynthesis protein [Hyphomicrobiales bacterium]MBV8662098.1 glucan biosynthesis protein [Hyphomicrobiales bacterium]
MSVRTNSRRRDFLKLTLGSAFAAAAGALEIAAARAEPLAAPAPFAPANVLDMARALAKSPFKPPKATLPDVLSNLTFEQYSGIRRVPGTAIWNDEKIGFALEPLHRGFVYATPVQLFVVENGQAHRIVYDRSAFDFGKLQLPPDLPELDFSGVRVLKSAPDGGWQDLALFQGATFFRSLARGQGYGVDARGLSIRTGDAQGEEFPLFRSLWIEKPGPAAGALVIHALLDSPSLTGAFHFTLHPGDATIIDTELTLVTRTDVDHLGLGVMTATYLFGPLDHHRPDDVRPSVYDVAGLQILTGAGEWLWRPIANRETLQISAFTDVNPRGFGFLQRDRSFDNFQDDDSHWELRPSLWIEPIGDWGEGEVVLLEIPSDSENNDNMIAQWRPKAGLAEGATVSFAYRQFWCWSPPTKPDFAIVAGSREGKLGKRRRFVVEFVADQFADPQKTVGITAAIEAAQGQIVSNRLFAYKDRRSVRVVFDLDPGSETYSELRVVLKSGGQSVSETWLYRWTA